MRLAVVFAFLLTACSRAPTPSPASTAAPRAGEPVDAAPAPAPLPLVAADAAPPPRSPLAGFPEQVLLSDPKGARLGVVSVPLGTREKRPIMIALHGGSDHPEWACNAWRGITGGYPFLVCPHGVGTNEASLAWSSTPDTKLRVARALEATKAMFADWILETSTIVLVGFSMGATQTAFLARGEPLLYKRVVLAESAYAPEPAMAFAQPWAKGGGERAIFLCTTLGCEGIYRRAAQNVAKQGVPARLDIAGTKDHGMWDQVVQSMRRDWPWLVEGAEGWASYTPADDGQLPGKTEFFDPR